MSNVIYQYTLSEVISAVQKTLEWSSLMNKCIVFLVLLLFCALIPQISRADDHICSAGYTQEEIDAALEAAPWEGITHSHGGYGEHSHEQFARQVELPAGCLHRDVWWDQHPYVKPESEPEPKEIPVIENYTTPAVLVCVGGPCLEKEKPNQVIGPVDLEGNVPPEPEPGDPEIFYPTIVVDDLVYWDSTREPYQVSEEAENAENPEGYRLQDIDGTLFLVPYGDKQTPVEASEETPQQETFIIYRHVNVIGGQDYLEPTPFHAHPVEDATLDPTPTGEAPQGGQQAEDSQGEEDTQQGLDIQQDGTGKTFASLTGKFYQVTSNPAIPLQVTEYMVDTWGNGQKALPQWIEIYNPNTLAVNLVGYEFAYVYKKQMRSITLRHFLIPPEGVIILATHIPRQRYRYGGISDAQVYNLQIENALKQGWLFKDPLGNIIFQTGKRFGEKKDPIKPERQGISRVSFNVYDSEHTRDTYFFGFGADVSTPGFYEPKIPRSPILLRQRMKTTWASLKRPDR